MPQDLESIALQMDEFAAEVFRRKSLTSLNDYAFLMQLMNGGYDNNDIIGVH